MVDGTEVQLIKAAIKGDSSAFGALYDRYHAMIYRFVMIKVGRREEAEDITHQVFLSAWQKVRAYKHRGYPFSSWLYQIARNQVIDHYRSRKPDVSLDTQGMRAAAIKVDEVVGVAGFVTPGMRVDVLISGNPPGTSNNSQGTLTKTLLQNIEVLSAGTDIQKDAEGKPQQVQVVNLLVNPQQAELLSLAGNETHIQLVLRNPLDTQQTKPAETSMAQLFDEPGMPAPRHAAGPVHAFHAAPRVYLVQVINGSKQSESKFPAQEEKQ